VDEQDEGAWGATVPTTHVILNENLGFIFEVDQPCTLAGFRLYQGPAYPQFALFQLWDMTPFLLAEQARIAADCARPTASAGWRHTWLHPRIKLAAATPYLVNVCCTDWYANFGALNAAPWVDGHFTVYQSGFSPGPLGGNGFYDPLTDTGQLFSFH
jgi:Domain of unknown function (DUF4082)